MEAKEKQKITKCIHKLERNIKFKSRLQTKGANRPSDKLIREKLK